MTQADLAQLAGTSRESVSRFLATLERAGVVRRRARPGHGARAPPAARLHLLMPSGRRAPAKRWSSASCAGAGSTTSGCSRRWVRCRESVRAEPALRRPRLRATRPLPIGHGQTISQPWVVAAICQALELSGPSACSRSAPARATRRPFLPRLAGEVLCDRARAEAAWRRAGELPVGASWASATSRSGSATAVAGTLAGAPFDAIAVHAAAPPPAAGARPRRCAPGAGS